MAETEMSALENVKESKKVEQVGSVLDMDKQIAKLQKMKEYFDAEKMTSEQKIRYMTMLQNASKYTLKNNEIRNKMMADLADKFNIIKTRITRLQSKKEIALAKLDELKNNKLHLHKTKEGLMKLKADIISKNDVLMKKIKEQMAMIYSKVNEEERKKILDFLQN